MGLTISTFFIDKIRDTILVVLVFLVSLGLCLAAFWHEKQRNFDFGQDHFNEETTIVENNLRRTFDAYAQVLRSGVALYMATDRVDRQIWSDYVSNLQLEKNYPGIQGVSYNAILRSTAERDAFEKLIQQTDFTDWAVRPRAQQDIYVPIVYLEPYVGRNRPALGFDIYSEPNRRAAVDRAIATNEPSMTSKITLVQDDDTEGDGIKAGVLVVLPIFEQTLDPDRPNIDQTNGLIVSVFRIRDLMRTILKDDKNVDLESRKSVSLFEVTPEGDVLDMFLAEKDPDHTPIYRSERTFEMYGKVWHIVTESKPSIEAELHRNSHILILLAGLLMTVLMTLTVASLVARSRDSSVSAEALRRNNVQIELLMKEVNHRSKNLLGLIQAIARQTSAGNPADFSETFGRRLASLSSNQDLLVKSKWQDVELSALVRSQLAHFEDLLDSRIIVSGPETYLDAANAQTLSMAIHELATNATKYGALSNDRGLVHVSWHCEGTPPEKMFHLNWVESGGPKVTAPDTKGFGTKVTGVMAELSLEGEISRSFAPEGLSWHLTCPHRKLVAKVTLPEGAAA